MIAASEIPDGLLRTMTGRPAADGGLTGEAWLAGLPALVAAAAERWELELDRSGPLRHGQCALVVPVHHPGGHGALKVTWPHAEAAHEHRALGRWRGHHAVQLLAADPASWTMLLERLDAEDDLAAHPVLEGCEQIGQLIAALALPAPPWAPLLSDHLRGVAADLDAAARDPAAAHSFPRRLLQQARSLVTDLARESDVDATLLHTDLHQHNVLRRPYTGEWAAIDPKPVAGHPAHGVAPALWNRWDAAEAANDARVHLALRLETLCAAGGIDADLARAHTHVRLVELALDAATRDEGSSALVTRAVTIIKAVQDP